MELCDTKLNKPANTSTNSLQPNYRIGNELSANYFTSFLPVRFSNVVPN
jgi:hypothetical protein